MYANTNSWPAGPMQRLCGCFYPLAYGVYSWHVLHPCYFLTKVARKYHVVSILTVIDLSLGVKLGTWLASIRKLKNVGTEKLVNWRPSSPASVVKASANMVQKCRTSPTHNSMLVKVGRDLRTFRRMAWYPADVQQIIAKQSRLGLTNPNLIKGNYTLYDVVVIWPDEIFNICHVTQPLCLHWHQQYHSQLSWSHPICPYRCDPV